MVKAGARIAVWLMTSLVLVVGVACGQGNTGGSEAAGGSSKYAPPPGGFYMHPPFLRVPGNQKPGFLEKSAAFTSNLFLGFGARITQGEYPNTRIVYRHIRVWYLPCEPMPNPPAAAPVIMTDMFSGSRVYLNTEGLIDPSPNSASPEYRSEMGRARLEAVLGNKSLMEDILAFLECPERVEAASKPKLCSGLSGWPDYDTENIGEPPIPKVGIAGLNSCMGLGWTVSYCWPTGAESRTCEEGKNWSALSGAEARGIATSDARKVATAPWKVYITVVGDESSPGRVSRIQAFPILQETPELELGNAAYTLYPHGG